MNPVQIKEGDHTCNNSLQFSKKERKKDSNIARLCFDWQTRAYETLEKYRGGSELPLVV